MLIFHPEVSLHSRPRRIPGSSLALSATNPKMEFSSLRLDQPEGSRGTQQSQVRPFHITFKITAIKKTLKTKGFENLVQSTNAMQTWSRDIDIDFK